MQPDLPTIDVLLNQLRQQIHPHLNKYKVVFVDDEPVTAKYFKKIFNKSLPSEVVTFTSGEMALDYIKQQPSLCALILTDELMPKMKGHELLDHCRAIAPKSVRMITSVLSIGHVNYGTETIHMPVVTKPWNIDHLNRFLLHGLEYFILRNDKVMQSQSDELTHYKFQHWIDDLMSDLNS